MPLEIVLASVPFILFAAIGSPLVPLILLAAIGLPLVPFPVASMAVLCERRNVDCQSRHQKHRASDSS
jgi:hypothetical protein